MVPLDTRAGAGPLAGVEKIVSAAMESGLLRENTREQTERDLEATVRRLYGLRPDDRLSFEWRDDGTVALEIAPSAAP